VYIYYLNLFLEKDLFWKVILPVNWSTSRVEDYGIEKPDILTLLNCSKLSDLSYFR